MCQSELTGVLLVVLPLEQDCKMIDSIVNKSFSLFMWMLLDEDGHKAFWISIVSLLVINLAVMTITERDDKIDSNKSKK